MLLTQLQQCLQEIYELDIGHDINQFVCTDRALIALLDASVNARDIPEKLLLRQEGDTVDVTLYLDAALLSHLAVHDPVQYLHAGNLAQYWITLEGISHFIYFAWNSHYDRPVSLFEMELQAEVDKYITSLFWLTSQHKAIDTLHASLFADVQFDAQLSPGEHERYRLANEYAAWYCAWLQRTYIERGQSRAITNEVRRFYRLPHTRKTRYIDALQA